MTIPLLGLAAMAADTTEPFDPGVSDVDFYVGVESLAPDRGGMVFGDMMLGMGLTPRLSAYVGSTLSGGATLVEGDTTAYLGLYGTPVDTDHVDCDVFFDLSNDGGGLDITPAIELNLDLAPDLQRAGVYLRFGGPIHGHVPVEGAPRRAIDLEWNPGAYLSVRPGQQVLLEGAWTVARLGEAGSQPGFDGVALGYNAEVTAGIEMINQIGVSRGGVVGLSTGFIATLP